MGPSLSGDPNNTSSHGRRNAGRPGAAASTSLPSEPGVSRDDLNVLYEDNHLLVVDKPPGVATMGVPARPAAPSAAPSLVQQARLWLKRKYKKPGNVYVGVVSRLDQGVGGVLVLAKTSKAAARLSRQFAERTVEKRYWALVAGRPEPEQGEWCDWLVKDEAGRRMRATPRPPQGGDARQATLAYRVLGRHGAWSLLQVEPRTGRKHQIRVQLSAHGWPLVGDRKYGGPPWSGEGIALHAVSLSLDHPTTGRRMTFHSHPGRGWNLPRGLGRSESGPR